jgi:hypothetical protein
MIRTSSFAGCLLTAFLIAGCAGSDVGNEQTNVEAEAIARPERVFVYDFASTTSGVAPNSAISEMIAEPTTPQTPEEIELGRQLGALVAVHLIEELNDNGIPAISAGAGPVLVPGDAIVRGEFISIDEGSRIKRVVIGFGAGSAELKTLAEAYVVTSTGLVSLGSAEVEAEGGKMPGMVVSLGVGSAATIAASGASKVFTEAGPEGIDGAAKRTAKEIAELMVAGYKRRGWM